MALKAFCKFLWDEITFLVYVATKKLAKSITQDEFE